jgi:hypothetical protein
MLVAAVCHRPGRFECHGHLTESRIPFSKPSIEPIIQHCAHTGNSLHRLVNLVSFQSPFSGRWRMPWKACRNRKKMPYSLLL